MTLTPREKIMALTIVVLAAALAVLAHSFSSARSQRDEAVAALTLVAGTAVSMTDEAEDANARSLLRNGAIALESYYAEAQGFQGADATALSSIEPGIEWITGTSGASSARSQVRMQLGTPSGGYTLTTRSESGHVYGYARDEMASVTRTCARGDAGKDCVSPTW